MVRPLIDGLQNRPEIPTFFVWTMTVHRRSDTGRQGISAGQRVKVPLSRRFVAVSARIFRMRADDWNAKDGRRKAPSFGVFGWADI